jgi:fatty acid-binding protein DegV
MIVLTDSAADLQPAEKTELGIEVAPLIIQFPEGEVSAEEISPDDFYSRLRAMVPQGSRPPPSPRPGPSPTSTGVWQAGASRSFPCTFPRD